jgi:hypothetical protein
MSLGTTVKVIANLASPISPTGSRTAGFGCGKVKPSYRRSGFCGVGWLPGTSIFLPGDAVRQPGGDNSQPGNAVHLPGNPIFQPGEIVCLPGIRNFQPGNPVFHPGSLNFLPGNAKSQPGNANFLPGCLVFNNLRTIHRSACRGWSKNATWGFSAILCRSRGDEAQTKKKN